MIIRTILKTALAITALAAGGIIATSTATAATTTDPFCDTTRAVSAGNGWSVFAPSARHRTGAVSQACYLRYGDRGGGIDQLKYDLRFCYGIPLPANTVYDAATKAAVIKVQKLHGITADGIYGPQTFKAMRWRLFTDQGGNSQSCYRPFVSRTVTANPSAGSYSPYCRDVSARYAGGGWFAPMPGTTTRTDALSFSCYLKQGDLSGGVSVLQDQLRTCYHSTLTVTGRYDSRTKATVAAVQRLHGITPDGVYGPATMRAMYWKLHTNLGPSERCYSPF